MNNPKFSVLLPTHNRLELLSRALQTVIRQDYADWEVIVSDNFSTEDIESYIQSLDDKRIKYVSTDSFIPVTDNWQNALNHSCGDYVIMLGDDDGLLPGYFSLLSRLIEQYQEPEVVYTGALLFAYPNVIPGCPEGFLRSYENRKIYQNSQSAFLLDQTEAQQLVLDSMNFIVQFDYNMQFSLVSRKLIERLADKGDFYQSPYPDYYASNVIMWVAESILIAPQPAVAVGISPKSFGYYYFNNAEGEGNKFLNNSPTDSAAKELQEIILPGPVMNTSWLFSMQAIKANFPDFTELKPNYERYRLLQICAVFADKMLNKVEAENAYTQLKPMLTEREWSEYGQAFEQLCEETAEEQRKKEAQRIMRLAGSHPAVTMPSIPGHYSTMLDVFENNPIRQG